MRWKSASLIVITSASFLLFDLASALPQQQTAPGAASSPNGRGAGRGGGFTQPEPIDFDDHSGWTSLFDGQTLNGWDGDKRYWRVQDGAIVVESTCEKPTGTIYLIWQGGEAADFELKLEMKGEGAAVNSGVQYRGA